MAAVDTPGTQLALPVELADDALFDTFVAGSNQDLIAAVKSLTEVSALHPLVYVWGPAGQGKTHLLHATCAAASQAQMQVMYIPLREFQDPEHRSLLQGLDGYDLVCLDDVDAVTHSATWCDALFELYNRLADSQHCRLLISASSSASALDVALPDLRSRLQAATPYALRKLSDEERVLALQVHASQRGLHLETEVGHFMVQRLSRDMHALMQVLNRLDKASMAAQRRLTVPFVKDTLSI
jgi:DnaA family protein